MKKRFMKLGSVVLLLVGIVPYLVLGHLWWAIFGGKTPIQHIENYMEWLDS